MLVCPSLEYLIHVLVTLVITVWQVVFCNDSVLQVVFRNDTCQCITVVVVFVLDQMTKRLLLVIPDTFTSTNSQCVAVVFGFAVDPTAV